MSFHGDIGGIVEMRRTLGELTIEWRIHDFFSLSSGSGDHYISPMFDFFGARWYLRLYPNGLTQTNPPSGWVNLIFYRQDFGLPKTLNIEIRIQGAQGVKNKKEIRQEFCENDRAFCWFRFCTRSDLLSQKSKLMPGNFLIIRCDMKCDVTSDTYTHTLEWTRSSSGSDNLHGKGSSDTVCRRGSGAVLGGGRSRVRLRGGLHMGARQVSIMASLHNLHLTAQGSTSDYSDSFTQTDSHLEAEVLPKIQQSREKQGIETLVKDFGKLLESGENSDVTVQVGDTVFKVHKAILSVRSPVLSAMFKHETAERSSNKVIIEDCEPDIFREYLHYIYSGFVQLNADQNAFKLYKVADKYLADNLKSQCLEYIQETLCVQTFCDTVKLALVHGEADLLKLAMDFAIENIREIVSTVEWKNFIREYPTEANEIFIKSLGPLCTCQKSKH